MTTSHHTDALFNCPIGYEIMTDPVICADGHSYQRANIAHWFRLGNTTSPLTGLPLTSLNLIPNYALRNIIRDQHPDLFQEGDAVLEENISQDNNDNLNQNVNTNLDNILNNDLNLNDSILLSLNNLIVNSTAMISNINFSNNNQINILDTDLNSSQLINGFTNIITFSNNILISRANHLENTNNENTNNRENLISLNNEDSSES